MLEPGTRVIVACHMPPGHVRTPAYLRGQTGTVERALGAFPNPEALAYGLQAERVPLYRVTFRLADLWDSEQTDTLDAEIYAHWLKEV
ncbi:MAG: SH3-like domain-containing protein [Paracoccaceae bacterium]